MHASACSLTGNRPLTVSDSQRNGTNCLTLTQDGHSGGQPSATARIPGEPYGTFRVIGPTVLVAIQEQGDTGQNAGLVFTAAVDNGKLGMGIDSGVVKFGAKGGC